MTSFHRSLRTSAVTLLMTVAGTLAFGQPPNVVQSDDAGNTAGGSGALQSNTAGAQNTAFGDAALSNNTIGGGNVAFGNGALAANTSGFNNTAIGILVLTSNTTGRHNTVIGSGAMFFNSSGEMNTASGLNALRNNDTGSLNTADGYQAMFSNTSGTNNDASGYEALYSNTVGTNNAAFGYFSMFSNTVGSNNTAVGVNALGTNQGGSNNIAIGVSAGYYLRGSRYNIDVGNVGSQQDVGLIRIGTPGQQTGAYVAGINDSRVTGSAVYVTSTGQLGVLASSERYKTAVVPMGGSTEKLSELRPVTFHLKTDPKGAAQYGLIAEEVAKVYPELVTRDDAGKIQGVRYEELAPMLLNEVQKQRHLIAAQGAEIGQLTTRLRRIDSALNNLHLKEEVVAQR